MNNSYPGLILAAAGVFALAAAIGFSGLSVECAIVLSALAILTAVFCSFALFTRCRVRSSENIIHEREGDVLHVRTR